LFVILLILAAINLIHAFYVKKKEKQKPAWKSKCEAIIENFNKQNVEIFYNEVCKLGNRYKEPAIARNIFFQSYEFLAEQNSKYALLLYLQYLNVKTSVNFRHKEVSEEHKEMLFRDKTQEARFQRLCEQLKENRNLPQAIDEAKQLFQIR
jgi:hypothetical protein